MKRFDLESGHATLSALVVLHYARLPHHHVHVGLDRFFNIYNRVRLLDGSRLPLHHHLAADVNVHHSEQRLG